MGFEGWKRKDEEVGKSRVRERERTFLISIYL